MHLLDAFACLLCMIRWQLQDDQPLIQQRPNWVTDEAVQLAAEIMANAAGSEQLPEVQTKLHPGCNYEAK